MRRGKKVIAGLLVGAILTTNPWIAYAAESTEPDKMVEQSNDNQKAENHLDEPLMKESENETTNEGNIQDGEGKQVENQIPEGSRKTGELSEQGNVLSNDSFSYSVENGTIRITEYKGNEKEVMIPESIDGMSVCEIGDSAFNQCTNIEHIEFPESVKTIGSWAFSGCTGLTGIELTDGITAIKERAFEGCTNLAEVKLPAELIELDGDVFANTAIKEITIPKKVKYVYNTHEGAFAGCSNLKKC